MSRPTSRVEGNPGQILFISENKSSTLFNTIGDYIKPLRSRMASFRRLNDMDTTGSVIVFEKHKTPLSTGEADFLKMHVAGGGGVIVLLTSKIQHEVLSSVNYFLEGFGISVCLQYTIS